MVAILLLCNVAWSIAAPIACDTANQLTAVRHTAAGTQHSRSAVESDAFESEG